MFDYNCAFYFNTVIRRKWVFFVFDTLTNRKLIAAYEKALELQLEKDFINLLKIEMESRGLLEKE